MQVHLCKHCIDSSCYAAEVSFKRILRNALLLASTWLASSGQHPHIALQIILQINHFCLHRLSLYITAALLNSKPIMALFALFDFPVGASCNHLQCPTYTCKGKRTHDWSALALSNEKIHQCCCQFNKMMQTFKTGPIVIAWEQRLRLNISGTRRCLAFFVSVLNDKLKSFHAMLSTWFQLTLTLTLSCRASY